MSFDKNKVTCLKGNNVLVHLCPAAHKLYQIWGKNFAIKVWPVFTLMFIPLWPKGWKTRVLRFHPLDHRGLGKRFYFVVSFPLQQYTLLSFPLVAPYPTLGQTWVASCTPNNLNMSLHVWQKRKQKVKSIITWKTCRCSRIGANILVISQI